MAKLYFNGETNAFLGNTALVSAGLTDMVPSVASRFETQLRTLSVQFGNGYKQQAPDGLNYTWLKAQVVFSKRSRLVIQEISNFLLGVGYSRSPIEYFYWTPPEPPHNVLGKYVLVGNPSIQWENYNCGTLSAVFEQTFEV